MFSVLFIYLLHQRPTCASLFVEMKLVSDVCHSVCLLKSVRHHWCKASALWVNHENALLPPVSCEILGKATLLNR